MENRTQKFCSIQLFFFQHFDHGAALKTTRKMSDLNIAFDRYASIGTVLHYILVISERWGVERSKDCNTATVVSTKPQRSNATRSVGMLH